MFYGREQLRPSESSEFMVLATQVATLSYAIRSPICDESRYESQVHAESTLIYMLIERIFLQNDANESFFSAICGGRTLDQMYALHIHIVRPAGPRNRVEKCDELVRDKRRRETCEKIEQQLWRASMPRY